MNIDDIRKLFDKEIEAGKGDLADIDGQEISNPIVQTSESVRLLLMAMHQGSPSISQQMEKLVQMVSPFSDYAEKILDDMSDETIQETDAALTLENLRDNISASEISIDEYKLNALQEQTEELTTLEQSAVVGLLLSVCTVNALPHSSALYSSSFPGDPQQMARQCEQECREANNLDKTIRAALDDAGLCDLQEKVMDLIEEIYKDAKSPAARQQAVQLSALSDSYKASAGSTLQFTACARLNVLNARQFIDDLADKIEKAGLQDLTATVAQANDTFNKLLDDISPALYGMLLTNCVAHKLLAKVS